MENTAESACVLFHFRGDTFAHVYAALLELYWTQTESQMSHGFSFIISFYNFIELYMFSAMSRVGVINNYYMACNTMIQVPVILKNPTRVSRLFLADWLPGVYSMILTYLIAVRFH